VLSDLFILRGIPEHIRSDNGPEFVAKAVQEWITAVGTKTAYITPASPWENGFIGPSMRVCAMSYSMAKSSTRLSPSDPWRVPFAIDVEIGVRRSPAG
jgi:transposase InsO family protein